MTNLWAMKSWPSLKAEGRSNAVRAALDIQRYCKAMNAMRSESGELQMFVGIGLNSGEAVCGNMVKITWIIP